MALLAPLYEAQTRRLNAMYGSRTDGIRQAYEALAAAGRGVGPAISDVYSTAGRDTAAFGKGFSDAVSQVSGGHADQATADLAFQGGPQVVTSGLRGGGGDALYAMGGAIPASQLAREGAGFAAAASFLPSTAAGLGADALRELESKRLDALLGLEGDRREAEYRLVSDLLEREGKTTSPTRLTSRTLANGQVQFFDPTTGRAVGRAHGPARASKAEKSPNLQARSLSNGQIQWFDPTTGQAVGRPVGPPRKASAAAKSKGYNLQAKSIGDGRLQWFDPRTGRPVGVPFGQPNAKSGITLAQMQRLKRDAGKIASRAWSGVKTSEKDENGTPLKDYMSYQEAMREGLAQGIPLPVMQTALNRYWTKPGMQTPRDPQGQGRPARSFQQRNPKAFAGNPAAENAANQWGGTTVPPSSRTGNVPSGPNRATNAVLAAAHAQIGTPYVWGAESPGEGFDCSGLIDWAYRQAGIDLPGRLTTYTAMRVGRSVAGQQLRPGDLLITNGGKHMVMYVGGGQVIAAPHKGEVVQYQPVSRFHGDIVDVRRVI